MKKLVYLFSIKTKKDKSFCSSMTLSDLPLHLICRFPYAFANLSNDAD